jgi:hypothetical protein
MVLLGALRPRADFEALANSTRERATERGARPAADRLADRYADLAAADPRHRRRFLWHKIQADAIAAQVVGALIGLGISLGMGLCLGLAEALYAGPLLRRHGTIRAMFLAYAELVIPTVGVVYSLLALTVVQLMKDPAQAAEAQAFLVLGTLAWLVLLAETLFLIYRRVTWWKRWGVYQISGICVSALVLSAYD